MTVFISGTIGAGLFGGGATVDTVRQQFKEEDGDEVTVSINSHGGDPFEGLAIMNFMRRRDERVVVEIDGLAASAASLVAMGGDEVRMPASSMMMIHNAWGMAIGDHHDMRDHADNLESITESMSRAYSRADVDDDELREMLDDETWMSADEAVEKNFADVVIEEDDEDDVAARIVAQINARAKSDLENFQSIPAAVASMAYRTGMKVAAMAQPEPAQPATQPQPEQGADTMAQQEQNQGAEPAPEEQTIEAQPKIVARDSQPAISTDQGVQGVDRQWVRSRCDDAGLDAEQTLDIVLNAESRDAAQEMIINALSQNDDAPEFTGRAPAHVTEDERDKFRSAAVDGIRMRATSIDMDRENPYRGHSFLRLAEASIRRAGGKVPTRDRDIFAAALGASHTFAASSGSHTRSDFPLILEDVMHKEVMLGWNRPSVVWQEIARTGTLQDFRDKNLISLHLFDNLKKVEEGEEYQHGSIGEEGASIAAEKYGRLMAITFEMLVDDDVAQFTRMAQKLGEAAAQVPERLAFEVLTENPTIQSTGQPLFSAEHGNTIDEEFSHETLKELRQAMESQTIETEDGDKEPINVEASKLVVPTALRDSAESLMMSEFIDRDLQRNTLQGAFDLVHARRLNAHSDTEFFLLADPQASDVIEVGFLDGQTEPEIQQEDAWNVDQTEFKVRIVCGAAPYDFRGMQRGGVKP